MNQNSYSFLVQGVCLTARLYIKYGQISVKSKLATFRFLYSVYFLLIAFLLNQDFTIKLIIQMEDQNKLGEIDPGQTDQMNTSELINIRDRINAQEQQNTPKIKIQKQPKPCQQIQKKPNLKQPQKQENNKGEQTIAPNDQTKRVLQQKQNKRQTDIQKLYKLTVDLNEYNHYKVTANHQQYSKDELVPPSGKQYNRVVKLKLKGKVKKGNTLLPYESFFNGYLTIYKNKIFYLFTCLHEFLHRQSIYEEIETQKITFESPDYQGELYCLDETPSIYQAYKQRIQAYKLRKRKYQQFIRKQQKSEKQQLKVYDAVQNDWIVLIPKKNQKQQILPSKIQVKIEGQMEQMYLRGYQHYLKLVSWQRQKQFGLNQKQEPKYKQDLKIKYFTDKQAPLFQYNYRRPDTFMHGFNTKKINSGSPFFQQISQKTIWVGMQSGYFCQKGIGMHFSKDFQSKTVNPLVQNLLKVCSSQKVPESGNSTSFYSNIYSESINQKQNTYPFTNLVQITAHKSGQNYYKFSNGILLNQSLVLVFLHNIYEQQRLKLVILDNLSCTFTGKQKYNLILPNKETLPAKIEAFEKLKRRWRKAIKDPDTVQNKHQLQLNIFYQDLLFLRLEKIIKPLKYIKFKCYEQSNLPLFLQAFDHRLNQQYKKMNISSHIIELSEQRITVSGLLYQTSQAISPFKSCGLIVKKQDNNVEVVGLNYDFLQSISMPMLFTQEMIQRISLEINKRKDQIAKQTIKNVHKIQELKNDNQDDNQESQTLNTFRVKKLYYKRNQQNLQDKIILKNQNQAFKISLQQDDLYYFKLQLQKVALSFQLSFKLIFDNFEDVNHLEYWSIYLSNKQKKDEKHVLLNLNLKVKNLSRPIADKNKINYYKFELKAESQIQLKFKFEAKVKNNTKEYFLIQTVTQSEYLKDALKNLNATKISLGNILDVQTLFNMQFKTKKPVQMALNFKN